MKKLIGVGAFVLLLSLPAHAQNRAGGGGSAPSTNSNGGGGGTGAGSVGGGTSGTRLPGYPRASFDLSAVSGGDPSFAPSTFLSFDQAVAEGKAIMAADRKSVAQTAAENSTTPKAKAKSSWVQDANGKVVPATQQ